MGMDQKDKSITEGCFLVVGNLVRLDLMGNVHLSSAIFPAVFEFKKNGKPILVVPSQPDACTPYDDDP